MTDNRNLLELTAAEKQDLERWARSRTVPAGDVFRARLILALADGQSYREMVRGMRTSAATIARWRRRLEQDRLAGVEGRHGGRNPRTATPAVQARVVRRVQQQPSDGSTHWSCRKLAGELGVSKSTVQRILMQARLKPHRLERYLASDDPDFEAKAADIIGLYLQPPQNAVVFCVDEKTAIQALDRLDPILPLSAGRAERHGFEYFRHGTLSLYAALNTQTGEVLGKTAGKHTSAEFVAFLGELVSGQPKSREIHVIVDNLSTHKTERVQLFLQEHAQVKLHFTPTYSSWLNQVELWFSKIERDVIARGVFSSVKDLAKKIMRYIRRYNRQAKPVKWTYKSTRNRIRPESGSNVTGH